MFCPEYEVTSSLIYSSFSLCSFQNSSRKYIGFAVEVVTLLLTVVLVEKWLPSIFVGVVVVSNDAKLVTVEDGCN